MKKTIAKINETKSWFFEKVNKIDEPVSRLIKKKRERAQVNKIRNEKEVTTDTTEIQRIIRGYYKQLYANKMDNLEEMDKFLERYNFPIKSNVIETVIKSLPTNKSAGPDDFTGEFYQTFREVNTYPSQTLPKIAEGRTLPNLFYEATINIMPKSDKYIINKENYRPISLMNTDTKILNKIQPNRIQQHIKRIIHHEN